MFLGITDLVEVRTDDGLYKYSTKSFDNIQAVAIHKIDMILRGYQDAFITAYKDGKRIPIKEVGATPSSSRNEIEEIADDAVVNVINKDLIVFKVQVGIFREAPPVDKQNMFDQIDDIKAEVTNSGLTRYVTGTFTSYKEAEKYRYKIINKFGVIDPFVVAMFNNEYISVQEALELLK